MGYEPQLGLSNYSCKPQSRLSRLPWKRPLFANISRFDSLKGKGLTAEERKHKGHAGMTLEKRR